MSCSLLLMSALTGCGAPTEQAAVPVPEPVVEQVAEPPADAVAEPVAKQVVVADLAHKFKKGVGTPYEISAAESLSLDLTGLILDSVQGDPTAVHVFLGRGRLYRFEHPGLAVLEMSAATAQPLAGSEPWIGFPAPSRATLSIGIESEPGALEGFSPLWTTEVEVK